MTELHKHVRPSGPEIRLFALREVADFNPRPVANVAEKFGISRQAAHRHVKGLVDEGSLIAVGSNRGRTYKLAVLDEKAAEVPLNSLEEHAVWRSYAAGLMEAVPAPAVEL